MPKHGWIGFDLDGTLAKHESGQHAIGEPIAPTLACLKAYLAAGYEVRIVTARASSAHWRAPIQEWCMTHIGQMLEVTDKKDWDMLLLYDDRAVSVEPNTGRMFGWRHATPSTTYSEADVKAARQSLIRAFFVQPSESTTVIL